MCSWSQQGYWSPSVSLPLRKWAYDWPMEQTDGGRFLCVAFVSLATEIQTIFLRSQVCLVTLCLRCSKHTCVYTEHTVHETLQSNALLVYSPQCASTPLKFVFQSVQEKEGQMGIKREWITRDRDECWRVCYNNLTSFSLSMCLSCFGALLARDSWEQLSPGNNVNKQLQPSDDIKNPPISERNTRQLLHVLKFTCSLLCLFLSGEK